MKHARGKRRIHARLLERLREVIQRAGAAGSDQRHLRDGAHRTQPFDVVTLPDAIASHAVENDLAGAACLHLTRPLQDVSAAVAGTLWVPAELPGTKALVSLLGVDSHHHALRAETLSQCVDQTGVTEGRRVDRHLIGSRIEHGLRRLGGCNAARNTERDIENACHAPHPLALHGPPFGACRNVIKNELVGALPAVPGRKLENVAHDLVVAEAHSLYNRTVAYVEAGDDASGKNGCNSLGVIRLS